MLNSISSQFLVGLVLILSVFTVACDNTEFDDATTENFGGDFNSESSAMRSSCFELVYPIQVTLTDGSTVDIDSQETLRTTKQADREANEDGSNLAFVFPLSVIVEEETIEVTTMEELQALKSDCKSSRGNRNGKGNRGSKGNRGGNNNCFSVVYPLTFAFEDGSTVSVESREELREAYQTFTEENPEATERPSVVYPITVTTEDGESIEVADEEALDALKESCSDDDEADDTVENN
jgi:hypothetical protein